MIKNFVFFICVTIVLCSCSLDYGTKDDDESSAPEFIFDDIQMVKIENGKKDSVIQADKMEQYRNIDAVFAQNVTFTVYNDEEKISIEGLCGLLSADNDNDIYTLSGEVEVTAYEQNLQIECSSLRWNNETEQLTNGKNELVTITSGLKNQDSSYAKPEKVTENSLVMTGYGLAASGVSRTYTVSQQVEGTIITGITE